SGPVVWSLTPRPLPNRPVNPDVLLAGTSHTAAARVGFHLLARGLDYHPGCLFSAAVAGTGELGGVPGLKGEGGPACAHQAFSGVVIAAPARDPRLSREVTDSYQPQLIVLRLGTLAEAIEEATDLPSGLRRYLEWVRDLPDRGPPPYLGARRFTDLY